MQPLPLEGHYGQRVPTDLCADCHLVWFDEFESVRLSGLGWVGLLRAMHAASAALARPAAFEAGLPAPAAATCVRCTTSRASGHFAMLECPRRHGHLQTFGLLLAERGLVRPLSRADLQALREEKREPTCLNCGAGIDDGGKRCSHCDSPLLAIDLPRLMAALLVRHAEPLPVEAAQHVAWPCRGCGAALEPNRTARCTHCHHQVVVPSVVDIRPLLDAVEPLLRAARPREARPHGARLRALRGDHRATAAYRYWRVFLRPDSYRPSGQGWMALAVLAVLGWLYFF